MNISKIKVELGNGGYMSIFTGVIFPRRREKCTFVVSAQSHQFQCMIVFEIYVVNDH